MLKAVPKRWFSSAYKMLDNDTTVAIVDPSLLREAAELTIQGSTYSVYREGLMSGAFILENGGSILARAVKPSALYRSFQVELGGKQYTLEAETVWSKRFVLSEGGVPVGSVYPERALSRKAVVDFPEAIPLAGRIFMFWLVMIMWNRSDAAASS
jgi:hypothetical protein